METNVARHLLDAYDSLLEATDRTYPGEVHDHIVVMLADCKAVLSLVIKDPQQ